MPHDQTGSATRIVPVVGMQIRAANARGLDFYDHLAGLEAGFGNLLQAHFIGPRIDQSFHRGLLRRAREISPWLQWTWYCGVS